MDTSTRERLLSGRTCSAVSAAPDEVLRKPFRLLHLLAMCMTLVCHLRVNTAVEREVHVV